jgi:hypothetical protein
MKQSVLVEIIGFSDGSCGPFPCDEDRTCGLDQCHPQGMFLEACNALREALANTYGDRVKLKITLLDEGVPERVRDLVQRHQPPLPMVLVDGTLIPLGRISFTHLKKRLEQALQTE